MNPYLNIFIYTLNNVIFCLFHHFSQSKSKIEICYLTDLVINQHIDTVFFPLSFSIPRFNPFLQRPTSPRLKILLPPYLLIDIFLYSFRHQHRLLRPSNNSLIRFIPYPLVFPFLFSLFLVLRTIGVTSSFDIYNSIYNSSFTSIHIPIGTIFLFLSIFQSLCLRRNSNF